MVYLIHGWKILTRYSIGALCQSYFVDGAEERNVGVEESRRRRLASHDSNDR